MRSRILLLTFTIILCGTASATQNDRIEYEILVDYVNCFYTEKYLERKKSEITKKEDKELVENVSTVFKKNVKSYSDFTLLYEKTPNSISIYDSFKGILKVYHPKAQLLWDYNEEKKKLYTSSWTKKQMIENLILLPNDLPNKDNNGFYGYLEKSTKELQANLQKQIPDDFFSSKNKGETDKDLHENNSSKRFRDRNSENSSSNWSWIIWLCFIGLITVLAYRFRKEIKYLSKRITTTKIAPKEKNQTQDILDYQKEYDNLKIEIIKLKSLEKDISQLRNKNELFENRVTELEKQLAKLTNSAQTEKITQTPPPSTSQSIENKPTSLYADVIIKDKFNKVSSVANETSIYELSLKTSSATIAEFTLYESNKRQVFRNADKIDGCEKIGTNAGATQIQLVKGEAQRDDLGQWRIIKKAKIKFV